MTVAYLSMIMYIPNETSNYDVYVSICQIYALECATIRYNMHQKCARSVSERIRNFIVVVKVQLVKSSLNLEYLDCSNCKP